MASCRPNVGWRSQHWLRCETFLHPIISVHVLKAELMMSLSQAQKVRAETTACLLLRPRVLVLCSQPGLWAPVLTQEARCWGVGMRKCAPEGCICAGQWGDPGAGKQKVSGKWAMAVLGGTRLWNLECGSHEKCARVDLRPTSSFHERMKWLLPWPGNCSWGQSEITFPLNRCAQASMDSKQGLGHGFAYVA